MKSKAIVHLVETKCEKICELCGESYLPSRSTQRFCFICGADIKKAKRKYRVAERISRSRTGELLRKSTNSESYVNVCKACGMEMLSQKGRHFCSSKCEDRYFHTPDPECIICGTPVKERSKQYCSDECKMKLLFCLAVKDKRYSSCKRCGLVFKVQNEEDSYCSNKCKWYANWEESKAISARIVANKKPEDRNCLCCNKKFVVDDPKSNQKFCTIVCRTTYRMQKLKKASF